MKLSDRIIDAKRRHKEAFPDGDWKAVNDEFSALFFEAYPILLESGFDPYEGGNEGRANRLAEMGF